MTSKRDSNHDITLKSPADLLSAVPYLLGYVPDDSLVLVCLDSKRIAVTLRLDLPQAAQAVTTLPVAPDMLRRNDVKAVVIAGYGPPERVTRCVDHARRLLAAESIEIVEALRVTDGRWWSYVCTEPACCPPEGTPVNPRDSPVDAAFTLGGMQALPHRQAVTAQLEPVKGTIRAAVTRATKKVRELLADTDSMVSPRETLHTEARALLGRLTADDAPLPEVEETVRLAAALSDSKLQAEALALIDDRGCHKTLGLWLWLTRHVAPTFRASPAALLAFAAWRGGNGVLATEAVRRALADDPRCVLAAAVGRLLNLGVPPMALPKLTATPASFTLPSPA